MALSGVPTWSTTAASNSSSDPTVNFAEGQAPSSLNDSCRAAMASVAKWRDDLYGITSGLSTGGTSTAYTVTTNATYDTAAHMSGAIFTITPHTTSGAAPTLAVDGLTARALNVSTGVAVPTGALISGTPYMVRYTHATTEFIVLNPSIRPVTVLDIIGGTSLTAIAIDDTFPIYDLSATANKRILISDILKVINLLTADAAPDTAADYVMTYDASATAAKKVLLSDLPGRLPRGAIDGCILGNGADATNDITVTAGVCRDSTNAVDITVPAFSTGKQLDANWAAGDAAGGRNSAAGIANSTYHVWAVRTAASATADIYFHTSATAATVLTALQAETGGSSYAYLRLIGSIVRVSNALLGFHQFGDEFWLDVPVQDYSAAIGATTAATATLASLPTGVKVQAILVANLLSASSASGYTYCSSLDSTDTAASNVCHTVIAPTSAATGYATEARVWTNTSAQVRVRTSVSGGSDVTRLTTLGCRHQRGRDA